MPFLIGHARPFFTCGWNLYGSVKWRIWCYYRQAGKAVLLVAINLNRAESNFAKIKIRILYEMNRATEHAFLCMTLLLNHLLSATLYALNTRSLAN